jgi:hypothetical protein
MALQRTWALQLRGRLESSLSQWRRYLALSTTFIYVSSPNLTLPLCVFYPVIASIYGTLLLRIHQDSVIWHVLCGRD